MWYSYQGRNRLGVYRELKTIEMPSNFWVEGNGPIGGSRRKWERNIRIRVEEIWRRYVDWIYLAQDVKYSCEYDNENLGAVKRGEFRE
jgi:hypothetical protein